MQELINGIAAKLGIDASLAEKAVGIILSMLKEQSGDNANSLLAALPGAQDLISKFSGSTDQASTDSGSSSLGGGLMGAITGAIGGANPLMEALSKLQSAGLDMEQSRTAGIEVLNYAKEKAGDDAVKKVTDQIPGLSQLL